MTQDKDAPLREDIRLLGRLLGDTVRDQQGEAVFELIEHIRQNSVRFRRDDDVAARRELEDVLDALSREQTIQVVRAFSYFSHLANIAEDQHHIRRTRAHLIAGSAPREGSLAHALAARNLHLTVLTNCLPVAMAMGTSSKCRVIICPGGYVEREGGVYGADTVEFIQRYHADKAFIGAGGLGPAGVTDADSLGCAIKRAMIERSDQTVLLADSSKFNLSQFERVCGLDNLDALVCDAPPPREFAASLRKADVRVTVAPKS